MTECIEWNGTITKCGYGQIRLDGKLFYVHRVAYTLYHGSIPKGLQIDHLCRNRKCFNPEHLEAVTNKENSIRGLTGSNNKQSKQTHCIRGHEFNESNTRIYNGKRKCLKCEIIYNKARYI